MEVRHDIRSFVAEAKGFEDNQGCDKPADVVNITFLNT